jgi:hypothetical protein
MLRALDQIAQDGEGLGGQLEALLSAPRPSGIRLDPDGGSVRVSRGSHGNLPTPQYLLRSS